MTEQDHSTEPTPASRTPAEKAAVPDSAKAAKARPGKKRSSLWLVVLVLVVLLVGLAAGLWAQHRDMTALRASLSSQGAHSAQLAGQANDVARQALDMAQRQSQALAAVQADLNSTRQQVQGLDQALQMVTDSGSDLLLLNDIDHLVTIAQQQLKLGGNVANAIISLETAQAQLSRANRPQMAPLQQAINGDVDRLRAVSTIDFPGLSAQLDRLASLVGEAPLLAPDTAPQPAADAAGPGQAAAPAAPAQSDSGDLPADAPWWRVAAHDAWQWSREGAGMLAQDLRGLFDVRRVDDAAALLISPDQAQRFREGLRQRTLTAQLALMMHQPQIWRSELQEVADAVDGRFDMKSPASREALKLARQLYDTPIEATLPTVDNSINAVTALRDALAAQEQSGPDDSGDEASPQDGDEIQPEDASPQTQAQASDGQEPSGNGTL